MSEPAPAVISITAEDKLREAKRELKSRRTRYPHLVKEGRLQIHEAIRRIAIMEAIADDYEQIVGGRLL
jgi:hypothetical protein